MLRASKQWDVRCPRALVRLFPVRRGYYYKIDRRMAQRENVTDGKYNSSDARQYAWQFADRLFEIFRRTK
jgi:hypothetical protein